MEAQLDIPRPSLRAEAVAFDLDNTLIDILHLKRCAAEAAGWALADAGMDIHPEKAAKAILSIALEIGLDRDDVVDQYVKRKLGVLDPRLVAVGRHAYERAEDANARPYPRAHRTLLELSRRGYALVIITDAPRHRAVRRLQSARLLHFFDELVTIEDSQTGKTTTLPFDLAAAKLGVRPQAIVMVGDNPRLDIGNAREAGCQTVLAQYGLQDHFTSYSPSDRPDRRIDWPDQLLRFLPARRGPGSSLTAHAQAAPEAQAPGEVLG